MEGADIWGYVISALGAGTVTQLVNWRLNKRKATAEVKQSEIEVIAATVRSVYEPIIEQQNKTIDQQNKRIAQLDAEVQKLRDEKDQMREDYQKQIAALEKRMLEISRAVGFKASQQARDTRTGRFLKNESGDEA